MLSRGVLPEKKAAHDRRRNLQCGCGDELLRRHTDMGEENEEGRTNGQIIIIYQKKTEWAALKNCVDFVRTFIIIHNGVGLCLLSNPVIKNQQ